MNRLTARLTACLSTLLIAAAIAGPARAAPLGLQPTSDPLIVSDAFVTSFFGDLLIDGFTPILTSSTPSAADDPAAVFINGGAGFVPPFVLSVTDALGTEILAGDAVAFGFNDANNTLEFLFDTTVDATGLFGPQILVFATPDAPVTDPFGPAADFDVTGSLVVTTPVPVPATASLLLAGLVAFGLARRTARQ